MEKRISWHEQPPKEKGHFLSLFKLSDTDKAELIERIAQSEGGIRIMVHPFYEYQESHQGEIDRDPKVEIGLQRLLEKPNDIGLPIIIFEADKPAKMDHTAAFVAKHTTESQRTVYVVPTADDHPVPIIHQEIQGPSQQETTKDAWDSLSNLLRELGVTKALVGGVALTADLRGEEIYRELYERANPLYAQARLQSGANRTDYALSACVGITIDELSKRGITIDISSLSKPVSGQEVRRFEQSKPEQKNI